MKTALDIYDDMPSGMKSYISNYGFHFNRKMCEFAVSLMQKSTDQEEQTRASIKFSPADVNKAKSKLTPKETIDSLLEQYGINVKNKVMYDHVFVYNMGKYDFLGRSIPDEQHLCMFVKDYLDDVDAPDDVAFRRWIATMVGAGEPIEWEDFL